jgi:hypothetical protein
MRSRLAAAAVVLVALTVAVRTGRAEPPRPTEPRPIADVLAALQATKAPKETVAAVRWYADVTHATTIAAPVGSPKTTLGQWSDNGPLLAAEEELGDCAPLPAAEAKAVTALHAEFQDALPPGLRGFALAQAGKTKEAVSLYRATALSMLPDGACPSEHPMYSYRRAGRMERMLQCVRRWAPKEDVADLSKAVDRAKRCAASNTAVG